MAKIEEAPVEGVDEGGDGDKDGNDEDDPREEDACDAVEKQYDVLIELLEREKDKDRDNNKDDKDDPHEEDACDTNEHMACIWHAPHAKQHIRHLVHQVYQLTKMFPVNSFLWKENRRRFNMQHKTEKNYKTQMSACQTGLGTSWTSKI